MKLKNFFKPTILKLIIFLMLAISTFYIFDERTCGASFFFSFCYTASGFPIFYIVRGDIAAVGSYTESLLLDKFFTNYGNFIFNWISFAIDMAAIYVISCSLCILLAKILDRFNLNKT